jgi:hypothetical protein
MKEFNKYQHLERYGTEEVLNIEAGTIHIFPKIDGTNASLWWNNGVQAGSRNRQLSLDNDNGDFYKWALKQECYARFFAQYSDVTLYGEWLIPHSLKTYRTDAWKKFYVFDVVRHNEDGTPVYLPYSEYKPILDEHEIEYLTPISIVTNCDYDRLVGYLSANTYLIEDGKGCGEGIVIKNYDFKNKYGRTTWAKIVTSEFREKHAKEMGNGEVNLKPLIEQSIVDEFVTSALVEKVYEKIRLDNDGFVSRNIPQLLNTVFYDLVTEDTWSFVKKHKNPTINFSMLQHLTYNKIKEIKKELFGS